MSLLEVINLRVYYPITSGLLSKRIGEVKAVDGVCFKIMDGESLGLVGESGCGKTTIAKAIVKLEKPTGGRVIYRGRDINSLSKNEEREYRKEVQMIFQDPHASLDPRMTVGDAVEEPLIIHGVRDPEERRRRVEELFDAVGLEREHMRRYPHEFSGGQKQRIGIARALAVKPRLIIADEPVSALDISVQAQVLNLFMKLQKSFNLSYLFIAHNLSVIRNTCDRVVVMYLGKVMEMTDTEEIFRNPLHPYTRMLLEAIPIPDPQRRKKRTFPPAIPRRVIKGCRFWAQCSEASDRCRTEEPEMIEVGAGHYVACFKV